MAGEHEPMGTSSTAGFIPYRANDGSWWVIPAHGYGFCGFGYGVGKPNPRVTRIEPYMGWDDVGFDDDGGEAY